jgi:putative Holliday junction resolvase
LSPVVVAGVRLGVDVGSVRIGVAASDPEGRLAVPVTVVRRDRRGDGDLVAIAALATEREAVEIVVGLPRSLSGDEGPAAAIAREYAERLAAKVEPIPVRLVDERLSTVEATRGLRAAGVDSRASRETVDAAAAAVILQHALDAARNVRPEDPTR